MSFQRLGISLLVMLVLTGAFLLRSQEMLSQNFLFLLDQGRDMMAVKSIVFDHHPTLIGPYTSLGGVFQGPLWYYVLAIPTFLVHGDPWGTIVLMVAVSMDAMIVAWWFVHRHFGLPAGIATLVLFAVSPEAVAAATYSWNPHPMWLLIPLYSWFLYEVTIGNERYHLFLWPTIGAMFHFQTALGVFFLLGTTVYVGIFCRSTIKHRVFLFGLLGAAVFFLPQFLFDVRHDFLMSRSVLAVVTGHDQGLRVTGESREVANLLPGHIGVFVNNFRSAFPLEGKLQKFPLLLFYFLLAMLFLPSEITHRTKEESRLSGMIVRIVSIVFLLGLVYPFPLRYWFLTGFQTFYLVLAGVFVGRLWRQGSGKIVCVIVGLVLVSYVATKLDVLYIHPPNDGGTAKIKGKLAAIDAIYADANGKPFGLWEFTAPVKVDAYDYLVWWRARDRYHFIPHQEKRGAFYLLIEPDSSQIWSYQGWLETVIKTGTIISTQTLPSGFIVQKRMAN